MTLRVTFELNNGREFVTDYGCDATGIKRIKQVDLFYDNPKLKTSYKPRRNSNIKGEMLE